VLDGRTPATFREVELEIAPDAAGDALDDVVTRLRAAGGSDADPRAKVARALGPAAGDPPDVTTYAVGSPATVDAVIRHALSDAVAKLVDADPVVRIGEDIEGVHQARVATRRLRSHLRTFRALLDPDWAWALREELGWLADELGTVRDADVLLDRLRGRIDALDDHDRAAAQPVLDRIRIDQAAARVDLIDALRSPRYLELLDHLVDAAHRPRVVMRVAEDDGEMLRALVRKPVRRLRGAVAQLPDPAPDAALHAVRILAKRARYAAEVMEPAFGRPARALARALTDVQDVLGEHQDAVVAGAWLRATALTLGDPAAVYVAGELGAVERAAAHAARHDWPETWRAASRPALRRWL
jgi:CHAD domain-containing protein